MALMHPEDIEDLENTTPGEKKVFRFLRETARPDKEFIGWYEPTIEPRVLNLLPEEELKKPCCILLI